MIDDQPINLTKHLKKTDLYPPPPSSLMSMIPTKNDENELDLTTFVPPPLSRKPPTQLSGIKLTFYFSYSSVLLSLNFSTSFIPIRLSSFS